MIVLRPYQHVGADFLKSRPHAFLLDEPRVGKTFTALEAALRVNAKRVLVFCPAIVVEHWRRSYAEMNCGFHMEVYSYHKLVTDKALAARLAGETRDVLLLDEAHALRTPGAMRTKLLYGKKGSRGIAGTAAYVWRLSGTLAPNNIGEVWTHFHNAGVFSESYLGFINRFCYVTQTKYGPKIRGIRADKVEEFKALIRPLCLRRRRRDIAPDLPPVSWENVALTAPEKELGGVRMEELVLTLGQKVTPETIEDHEKNSAALRRELSVVKTPLVVAYLAELLDEGVEKIVVFAWHRDMIDTIQEKLSHFGAVKILGGVSEKRRWAAIDRFRTDPECRVIVGQIDAMGMGIPLDSSNVGVFAEYSWNLGQVLQAAARIMSLTSFDKKSIIVPYLDGTMDTMVAKALKHKAKTAELINELSGA